MIATSARRRATLLLGAALAFIVLIAIAMACYAGGEWADRTAEGYHFTKNFLSDLGATHAWSGEPNAVSRILFSIALAGLGLGFIAFAGTWRAIAFANQRARLAGLVAQGAGTASGAAFIAVALVPIDVDLALHNACVIAAFGLLAVYSTAMTLLWWRNAASRVRRVASTSYVVVVAAYFGVIALAVRTGIATARGFEMLVVAQKAIVAVSMAFIVYITLAVRHDTAA